MERVRGAGNGWEPGAPQVTHAQADNTRAGVGKSSSAHRGPGTMLWRASSSLSRILPASPSTGVTTSQRPLEARRAGHPV